MVLEPLPSAQVMIPRSWDQVPHPAPCREPASPSAYVSASLCVSLVDKQIKSLKKKESQEEVERALVEPADPLVGLALPPLAVWWGKSLPWGAQGVTLETQDQVCHWAPHREPASPSAYVSLSVSLMNK